MFRKLLLLLCALTMVMGLAAAETPAPFTGYFEKNAFIRPEPAGSSVSLGHIPANTPVELTPVNDRFAEVTWQGTTGYVYYAEVKRLPVETPVEPYLAYLPENKYLFALPLDGVSALATVQAETPVTVTAKVDRFLRITAGAQEGYVYAKDTRAISDVPMKASDVEFYAATAVTAREHPLRNAKASLPLEAGRIYIAEATGNGYYRITVNGTTAYAPISSVTPLKRGEDTVRAAVITPETQLFTAPKQSAATETRVEERLLMRLDPQENGFQRVSGTDWYIRPNDVTAYALTLTGGTQLYIHADAALLLSPEAGAMQTGTVRAGRLYAAPCAAEGWYLLQSEGKWGFLRQDDAVAQALVTDEKMMNTAAVTTAETAFSAADGRQVTLAANTRLTLSAMAGDYYLCDTAEGEGCLLKADVRVLGSDTELLPYSVAAPSAVRVLDFPDAALGREAFVVPEGAKVKVTGFNRCYLMVQYGGKTGYAPQEGLLTAESEGIPATEDIPRYELVLDKSTGMTYVFQLTGEGQRGDLVICAEVGIGKRTTPTPVGTFLLGQKERWHTFAHTYTPHTTEYVKARYIHGWPCEQKDVIALKTGLAVTGMVTGGCLRSPFDFARWVYMNCTSYDTQLVIVGGGFEAPADAAAVQVK